MPLVLQQVRKCDGACCKESPRFPNAKGTDCIYHKFPLGKETEGCQLMSGVKTLTLTQEKEMSFAFPDREAKQVFIDTCVDWPQKNCDSKLGETAGCCWQWVNQ